MHCKTVSHLLEPSECPMSISADHLGFGSAIELLDQLQPSFVEFAQSRISDDLRSKFSASDVVQQTFLETLRELPSKRFGNQEQFLGWFYRLLNHNLIDICRGYRKSQKRDIKKESRLENWTEKCSAENALSLMVKAERDRLLRESLDLLPAHNRSLLIWRFIDEMSYAEIAKLTGHSEDSARMSVNRSLDKLNKILSSHVSLST